MSRIWRRVPGRPVMRPAGQIDLAFETSQHKVTLAGNASNRLRAAGCLTSPRYATARAGTLRRHLGSPVDRGYELVHAGRTGGDVLAPPVRPPLG